MIVLLCCPIRNAISNCTQKDSCAGVLTRYRFSENIKTLDNTLIARVVAFLRAEVAELVDALGSGPSGCKPVLVQIQSSAPFLIFIKMMYLRVVKNDQTS